MLKDSHSRRIDYLRISITDKCNLRCKYCIPPEGVEYLAHDEVMRNDEFIHIIGIFVNLGVKKIRFSGGEPLVRKGVIDILSRTRELHPEVELCLTTNGVLLDTVLDDLYRLKIKKINISLDTLSAERFKEISGVDCLDKIIKNIDRALSYDFFKLKINTVLFQETLDRLDEFFEYVKDKNIMLRFIEKMPFLEEDNQLSFVSSDRLIEKLKTMGSLERKRSFDTTVAIMYKFLYNGRYSIDMGVIPPVTNKFCSRCNRIRLTCDGIIKSCLNSPLEYDIKSLYRMDMGDDALREVIINAVNEKPRDHDFECTYQKSRGCSSLAQKLSRTMSKIGG